MGKILVLITMNEGVVAHLVEIIQEEFPRTRIVMLYGDIRRLKHYFSKLFHTDVDIAVINISCLKSLALDEIFSFSLPQKLHILDFCLNCCKDHHGENVVCLPPYAMLTRILVKRIETLFETLNDLRIWVKLSTQEAALLTKLLGIEQNQLSQSILACIPREEGVYHSIIFHAGGTEITVNAMGRIKGYKEKAQLTARCITHVQFKQVIGFFAHIVSALTLWLYREYLKNYVTDIITKIGYEEGLYTLYISKLIKYGADFMMKFE